MIAVKSATWFTSNGYSIEVGKPTSSHCFVRGSFRGAYIDNCPWLVMTASRHLRLDQRRVLPPKSAHTHPGHLVPKETRWQLSYTVGFRPKQNCRHLEGSEPQNLVRLLTLKTGPSVNPTSTAFTDLNSSRIPLQLSSLGSS